MMRRPVPAPEKKGLEQAEVLIDFMEELVFGGWRKLLSL
jgi:hypothetical protein